MLTWWFPGCKMLVIKAGIHKMPDRIVNREDSDQTALSDLHLRCLSLPFWQATRVQILEHLPYSHSVLCNA